MVMTLPLDEMSLADKILAMEILWDDLCRNADGFSSPAWHGEQLKEREEQLRQGKDRFEDWEAVKKELWTSLI